MARRSKIVAGLKDAKRHARSGRSRGTSPAVGSGGMEEREMSEGEMIIRGLKEALAYSRGERSVGKSRIVRVPYPRI